MLAQFKQAFPAIYLRTQFGILKAFVNKKE
jgi:hypothetical protein